MYNPLDLRVGGPLLIAPTALQCLVMITDRDLDIGIYCHLRTEHVGAHASISPVGHVRRVWRNKEDMPSLRMGEDSGR